MFTRPSNSILPTSEYLVQFESVRDHGDVLLDLQSRVRLRTAQTRELGVEVVHRRRALRPVETNLATTNHNRARVNWFGSVQTKRLKTISFQAGVFDNRDFMRQS